MRVLVTGVAGFIGSHVAETLLGRGHEVWGIDNFDPYYSRAIKEGNLAILHKFGGFHFTELDIREAEALKALAERFGPDRVLHLAALAGVQPSLKDPVRYQQVNVIGTISVLEAALAGGCRKVVAASSSSVYGDASPVPFSEKDPCDRPMSPYAASKRASELICATYSYLHGMDTTCLRFFTVYGPRQRPEMAIAKFVRHIREDRPIVLYGDGESARDYTFVDDIVSGTMACLERNLPGHRVYNLGNNHPVRLLDLVAAIEKVLGRRAQVRHEPARPGDVTVTWADLELASRDLDYRPAVSLEEGLARYVAWCDNQSGGSSN